MATVFLYCILIGGTLLVCQFIMTLIGLGDSPLHVDLAHDIPADSAGHAGELPHADGDPHHSSWLFGIISFRTLVAATTFFGLAGMLANRSGGSIGDQLLIAISSGTAAMFGVHWLIRSFYRLGQSGTLRITNAVGKTATVSVPIAPGNSREGKVQLQVQGRLEELSAVTRHSETLATGARVNVVGVIRGNVLEVEPSRPAVPAGA